MKTRTLAALSACCFLLSLLQLITLLLNTVVGVFSGAAMSLFSILLLKFFQIELPAPWVSVALPTVSSLAGVSVLFFARQAQSLNLWLAPLLACVLSLAVVGVERFRSKRCALCSRRLGDGVAFACPRCGLVVCDSCWVFERVRCLLCEQNRVTVFVPDARWWDRQFGPRTMHGRCQLCMVPAQETDLRACGKCGRPQCRVCWDGENGQCSRCKWIVADLPEPLHEYMIARAKP